MSKMTLQENITAEPEQTEQKQNTEVEITETEPQGGEDDTTQQIGQIDYKAELERERGRREKAEKVIAEEAWKNRRQKHGETTEIEERENEFEDEEEKPITKKELREFLRQDRQNIRKDLQSEIIAEKAKKIAGSDAEAEFVIEIHKNRIFPEGMSLDEQIEESYAIANRKKIMAQNEELKRALRSKDNVSNDATGTFYESPQYGEPKMNSNDLQAIKSAGFLWDGKAKLFVKQIAGGKKILTYDPKTKKQRVITK